MNSSRLLFFLFFLFLLNAPVGLIGFQTLDELTQYAARVLEDRKPDNNSWIRPNYTTYFEQLKPTLLKKLMASIKHFFGTVEPAWDQDSFEKALASVTHPHESRHVLLLAPQDNTDIIIWSDLFGAFHSLVRDLIELQKKQIINNNLEIVKENCFFVFYGNLFDGSAYPLELLSLVVTLMQKNKDKIVYLKGRFEKHDGWKDTTLYQALKVQATQSSKLENLIRTFFKGLPQALYIQARTKASDALVLICPADFNRTKIHEQELKKALLQVPQGTLKQVPLEHVKNSKQELIKGIITHEHRDVVYTPHEGLRYEPATQEIAKWLVFSGGNQITAKLYHFYNDAFVTLTTANYLSSWTITLNKQDRKLKDGFRNLSFNFLTGEPVEKSKQEYKEKLYFGCTMDLTKSLSTLASVVQKGLQLAIRLRNERFTDQRLIKLIAFDDEYTPMLTLKSAHEFIKQYNSRFFLTTFGTPTTEVFLPMIEKKEVLVLFPYSGASIFRKRELTHIAHVRTSYENEAIALAHYAVTTLQAKKFAIFYQNDSFGNGPREAVLPLLKKLGITEIMQVPYMRNNADMKKQAKTISDFGPDVIMLFSVFAPSAELIRQIGIANLSMQYIMSISAVGYAFSSYATKKGLNHISSNVVPNPFTSNLPIVKEYRYVYNKEYKGRSYSPDSLEGYINGTVLSYLLDRIEKPVTMDTLIEQIEAVKKVNLKGLLLDFNPDTRELMHQVWLDTGEDTWKAIDVSALTA